MTIGHYIDELSSAMNKKSRYTYSYITDRHYYSILNKIRGNLIYKKLNKRQSPGQGVYTSLECIEMIHPDKTCGCSKAIKCNIRRSKYKIPASLGSIYGSSIRNVRSNGDENTAEEYQYDSNVLNKTRHKLKYVGILKGYLIKDDYLYIRTEIAPKYVSLEMIAVDIIEFYSFESVCNEYKCKPNKEFPFPIEPELANPMMNIAKDEVENIIRGVFKQEDDSVYSEDPETSYQDGGEQ